MNCPRFLTTELSDYGSSWETTGFPGRGPEGLILHMVSAMPLYKVSVCALSPSLEQRTISTTITELLGNGLEVLASFAASSVYITQQVSSALLGFFDGRVVKM
jgi:hypothetical protein